MQILVNSDFSYSVLSLSLSLSCSFLPSFLVSFPCTSIVNLIIERREVSASAEHPCVFFFFLFLGSFPFMRNFPFTVHHVLIDTGTLEGSCTLKHRSGTILFKRSAAYLNCWVIVTYACISVFIVDCPGSPPRGNCKNWRRDFWFIPLIIPLLIYGRDCFFGYLSRSLLLRISCIGCILFIYYYIGIVEY